MAPTSAAAASAAAAAAASASALGAAAGARLSAEGGDGAASVSASFEAAPAADVFRAVTFNVRRFKDGAGECSAAAVGDALARLQPSVVALNEVDLALRPEALRTVAARLGEGFEVAFFGHAGGRYGNALLSRYPISAVRETHLRGGSQLSLKPGTLKRNGEIAKEGEMHRIARGLLECDLRVPAASSSSGAGGGGGAEWTSLTVAVTHLDHISEAERLVQVEHVVEALGGAASSSASSGREGASLGADAALAPNATASGAGGGASLCSGVAAEAAAEDGKGAGGGAARPAARQPLLVIGDFNALTRSDYSEEEWQVLEGKAASNGWTPPQPAGCLERLAAAGLADAFAASRGGGPLAPGTSGGIFTAHVGHPMYRIDYCFASNGSASPLTPLRAEVLSHVHLSDHFPVVWDFSLSQTGARL